MAGILPEELNNSSNIVGKHILDVISSGMYSNPLMVIREYIQNSVDSIDNAIEQSIIAPEQSITKINIDGKTRELSVFDNGIGVAASKVVQSLCTIGLSAKNNKNNRGFRGIGRLGGLAYCKKLVFKTRYLGEDVVSTITWDAHKLADYLNSSGSLRSDEVLGNIVDIKRNEASSEDPLHFFKVEMKNVSSFHDDALMNIIKVKDFLSHAAPVGYNIETFKFAQKIDTWFKDIKGYQTYNLFVNEEKIFRPYANEFQVLKGDYDEILEVETFEIPDCNGEIIGKGWYAHSSFKASIPPSGIMRGIRVRQGNIAIGDEYFLDSAFKERRFAQWHIGEIHLDLKVKTNARRDGFEHTNEHERFLEWMSVFGNHLVAVCRKHSNKRSFLVRLENLLSRIEKFLSDDFIISEKKADKHAKSLLKSLNDLEYSIGKYECNIHYGARIESLKEQLEKYSSNGKIKRLENIIDNRKLRNLSKKDILLGICSKLSEIKGEDNSKPIIQELISPYLK